MRPRRVLTGLLLAMIALAALLPALPVQAVAGDYALAGGHFFTQTGDHVATGFAVRDETFADGRNPVRFWSEFQRLGGTAVLGYPISRVYRDDDGFYYQLFQRAMLQWRPEANAAVFANVLDKLSEAGADPWLASLGIPGPVADDGSGGSFEAAVRVRLGWLTEPRIKAFYLAASSNGDVRRAIERYGLPASEPVGTGPFVVQRFQRIALQLWVDRVPGMPAPGTVVPVLSGDLYRQHAQAKGIGLADKRFLPQSSVLGASTAPPASTFAVDDGLRHSLDLLAANPAGGSLATALRTPGVSIAFGDVPAIALFSPGRLAVTVNAEWRNADPRAVAAVLAHEASHLADFLSGVEMEGAESCYQTEYAAFQAQAQVWQAFYGPGGKPSSVDRLDAELNRILEQVSGSQHDFLALLRATYRPACEG